MIKKSLLIFLDSSGEHRDFYTKFMRVLNFYLRIFSLMYFLLKTCYGTSSHDQTYYNLYRHHLSPLILAPMATDKRFNQVVTCNQA